MHGTKTKQIREIRRTNAEQVQARSTARPLNERVKQAGAKELAKLVKKYGEEEISKHRKAT